MELLHIVDVNDIPEECYLPSDLNEAVQKKRFLENFAATLVDKYILQLDKVELLLRKTGETQTMEVVQNLGLSADGTVILDAPRHFDMMANVDTIMKQPMAKQDRMHFDPSIL